MRATALDVPRRAVCTLCRVVYAAARRCVPRPTTRWFDVLAADWTSVCAVEDIRFLVCTVFGSVYLTMVDSVLAWVCDAGGGRRCQDRPAAAATWPPPTVAGGKPWRWRPTRRAPRAASAATVTARRPPHRRRSPARGHGGTVGRLPPAAAAYAHVSGGDGLQRRPSPPPHLHLFTDARRRCAPAAAAVAVAGRAASRGRLGGSGGRVDTAGWASNRQRQLAAVGVGVAPPAGERHQQWQLAAVGGEVAPLPLPPSSGHCSAPL